jgi:allantoicase
VSLRPFRDLEDLLSRGGAEFRHLSREDLLEAFAAHPRIGETHPAESSLAARWAAAEQAGARTAEADTRDALSRLNQEYERRFGHIYIVCATGKSAAEMLALLHKRLDNTPDAELLVAAEEQRKIMDLRLTKMVLN